jgi:alpha-ketoglutarate-dependent 2,4-dichlorophenoxyacetate dioxygenase
MAITVCPVTPTFAAEIGDVDLSRQVEPAALAAIKDAFAKYAVLIFPDQHLSQDQHLDFAGHFGPLETSIAVYRKDALLRVRQEFADVSNLNHNNELWEEDSRQRLFQLGNRLWQTTLRKRLVISSATRTAQCSYCGYRFLSISQYSIVRMMWPSSVAPS